MKIRWPWVSRKKYEDLLFINRRAKRLLVEAVEVIITLRAELAKYPARGKDGKFKRREG